MMAAQFENTDGTDIPLNSINFGSDFKGPDWDEDARVYQSVAPHVQLTGPNFTIVGKYYYVEGGVEDPKHPGEWIAGWVDQGGDGIDSSVKVTAGRGFWYRDTFNDSPLYGQAGQVVPDSPISRTYAGDFKMLANPFPQSVRLSDIKFIGIDENIPMWDEDASKYQSVATHIQVPVDKGTATTKLWYVDEGVEDPKHPGEYIAGWVDQGGDGVDPTQIVLPIGRACWFRPLVGGKGIDVEFTK